MTFNQIAKIARNNIWKLEECPAVFYVFLPWMRGWLKCGPKFGIKIWSTIIYAFKGKYTYEFTKEKEAIEGGKKFVKKYLKNSYFLDRVISEWQKRFRNVQISDEKTILKGRFKNFSNSKLWSFFDRIMKNYAFFVTGPLIAEAFDVYTEKVILPNFRKVVPLKYSEKIFDYFTILSLPSKRSFLDEERLSFLKLCLEFLNRKISLDLPLNFLKEEIPSFYRKIVFHSRKFYWTRNNYEITIKRKPEEFWDEIKKEIKKKSKEEIIQELKNLQILPKRRVQEKKRLRKILNLSSEIRKILNLLVILGWWQDQRKMSALKYTYFLNEVANEIARRFGYSLEDIQSSTPQEIEKLLKDGKRLDGNELKRRKKFALVYQDFKNFKVFSGRKAKRLLGLFLVNIAREERIQGIVAFRGEEKNFQGKVKIVLNVKKDIFKDKEILVTSMTRPEFVSLMKRAKAVVTDEGGLTSHAAIVCREFKIPCIIGTKIATKVLKNGDLVEVDVDKGIIKIVERR